MQEKLLWQEQIAAWLKQAVTIEDVFELRDWPESKVLRFTGAVADEQRTFYAKQSRTGMEQELAVFPLVESDKDFPAPRGKLILLAGEEWLLMEDARGIMLAHSSDPKHYLLAVRALARFHELGCTREWRAQLQKLVDLRERLPVIADSVLGRVDERVQSDIFMGVDLELLDSVRRKLASSWCEVQARLNSYPVSLVHGDCHGGNVFLANEKICLIDWGSMTLGPGLLDLVGLIDVAIRMGDQIGNWHELLTAYWSELLPNTRQAYGDMDEAFQMLRVCRALLELEWFVRSGEDYGSRANRELKIVHGCLAEMSSEKRVVRG